MRESQPRFGFGDWGYTPVQSYPAYPSYAGYYPYGYVGGYFGYAQPRQNQPPQPYWPLPPETPQPPTDPESIISDPTVSLAGIKVSDPALIGALKLLAKTHNLPKDEKFLQAHGVSVLFHHGKDAVDVLKRKKVSVVFDEMSDAGAHAEWISSQNRVALNKKYKGDTSLAVMLALSEAIYHEAGHAVKDGDSNSSIQEDLNCLALNAMAYRTHTMQYPWYPYFKAQGPVKPLFDNGVARYAQLFFNWDPHNPPTYQGPDPNLKRLVKRIADKYGDLQPSSVDHPIPRVNPPQKPLTKRIVDEILHQQAAS